MDLKNNMIRQVKSKFELRRVVVDQIEYSTWPEPAVMFVYFKHWQSILLVFMDMDLWMSNVNDNMTEILLGWLINQSS